MLHNNKKYSVRFASLVLEI